MDRILAEKEERYKKLVISKYDDLTDDEFVELAKNHVRECSYLLQRAKKTKAFIKKVIKKEIKSKKEKVVATDDENDEDVSRSFPWSNVPTPPTPNSEKLKYDEKDSSPLSTAPKTPSSFLPPKRKQTLSSKSKKSPLKGRKRKYSKTVAKYKVSKADSSLIPVTDSTQKDKSESFDLAVYADYGMPSFEFEFNPPSDAFLESLVTFIKFREPNLNLERLREASPLRKMGKAAIVGAPQRYYNVNADGNCGWRCISYALFGTVIYHWYIRKIITKWQAFGDDPRVAAEALPKWKIIEKQEERSTVKERHLWISETDLIAVAKYFRINILCYKHGMGDLEFDHWVCYSPDHSKNKKLEQEEEKYPDLCIDWSFTGEHYRVVTEFVTVL